MLFLKSALISLTLILFSCKTVGPGASDPSSWALNGNEAAAKRYIAATVVEFYTDTQNQTAVVETFAAALVDQKTDQTESSVYVLQVYADKGAGDGTGKDHLQQYILSQFIVLTNYLAYHADPKTTPLVFTTTKK
ncbi:MAG: hypothetical protein EOP10_00105 [Proteobacteria bacterium]|nr:MAG: hypothetical protein EOP10_00105 [Pseudomonadota bacterium]